MALVALWLAALVAGVGGQAAGQGDHAAVIELDGIINPVTDRFLARGLKKAARDGAEVVVVELDTPGGLLDSTRSMVEELFASPVPVAVYVAPSGARAASAGTFITAAANFAVMAPVTNIGAASPISGGGEDIGETLEKKIFQDTAAFMRDIAERRGRNVEALEATVLEALAYTSGEAVEMGVVDFIAEDINELLELLDGRTTTVVTEEGTKSVTLATRGLETRIIRMGFFDRLLGFIADPNIAFLLLSLGSLALVLELLNPGTIIPGLFGVIALVLAFMALGSLPVNWAGVALILLAAVLVLVEVNVAGFGIFGAGAIISFVLGGILLFSHFGTPSPTLPAFSIRVNSWLLGTTAGVLSLGGGGIMWMVIQSRRESRKPVVDALVGAIGHSTTALDPEGQVWVRGETWTARSRDEVTIGPEEEVRVVAVDGPMLTVERAAESAGPGTKEGGEGGPEEQTEA